MEKFGVPSQTLTSPEAVGWGFKIASGHNKEENEIKKERKRPLSQLEGKKFCTS